MVSRMLGGTFPADHKPTVGMENKKTVVVAAGKAFSLNLWDRGGGGSTYGAILKAFYKKVSAAMIVFDVNSYDSFECIQECVTELVKFVPAGCPVLIVGNKVDLAGEVDPDEARQLCSMLESTLKSAVSYSETSSADGRGVSAAFEKLACMAAGLWTAEAEAEAAEPDAQIMTIEVPEGVEAGQTLLVTGPQGNDIEVEVPQGVVAGDTFEIAVAAEDKKKNDDGGRGDQTIERRVTKMKQLAVDTGAEVLASLGPVPEPGQELGVFRIDSDAQGLEPEPVALFEIEASATPAPPGEVETGVPVYRAEPEARSNRLTGPAAELCGKLFDAIDEDSSGFLEEAEGKKYLSCSGCNPTNLDYYWSDLLRTADENGDGRISKDEFLVYILRDEELDALGGFDDKEHGRGMEVQLRLMGSAGALCGRLFDAIDVDESGSLEEAEGKNYLSYTTHRGLHNECDASDLDNIWSDLLRAADKNGDACISKAEFLEHVLSLVELDEFGGFVDKAHEVAISEHAAHAEHAAFSPVKKSRAEDAASDASDSSSGTSSGHRIKRFEVDRLHARLAAVQQELADERRSHAATCEELEGLREATASSVVDSVVKQIISQHPGGEGGDESWRALYEERTTELEALRESTAETMVEMVK